MRWCLAIIWFFLHDLIDLQQKISVCKFSKNSSGAILSRIRVMERFGDFMSIWNRLVVWNILTTETKCFISSEQLRMFSWSFHTARNFFLKTYWHPDVWSILYLRIFPFLNCHFCKVIRKVPDIIWSCNRHWWFFSTNKID